MRQFVIWSTACLVWVFVFLLNHHVLEFQSLRLWGAYALPAIALAIGVLGCRLARQAPPLEHYSALIAGLLYIGGGTIFDLYATYVHSPALDDEANAALRALLDSSHSLRVVYVYALLTNAVCLGTLAVLWWAFLRHQRIMIETAAAAAQRSWWKFLKAGTGGAELTWRQWLLPMRYSEMPQLYYWVWPIVASMLFASSTVRWYAGLEWFEIVRVTDRNRVIILGLTSSVPGLIYFAWLGWSYRSQIARFDRG